MKFLISKDWLMSRAHLEEGQSTEAGSLHAACYEAWFAEVLALGNKLGWKQRALDSIDRDAWLEYYNAGCTAAEAWREEYEAAS